MIRGRPDRLTSACYLDRTRTVPLVLTVDSIWLITCNSLSLSLSRAFLVSSYIGGRGLWKRKFSSGIGEQFILVEGPSLFRKSQGLFFHDALVRAFFYNVLASDVVSQAMWLTHVLKAWNFLYDYGLPYVWIISTCSICSLEYQMLCTILKKCTSVSYWNSRGILPCIHLKTL